MMENIKTNESWLSMPFMMLLNFASGIAVVGGVWLILVGQWVLVVSAVISTLVSTCVLGLLMAPALLFVAPLSPESVQKKKSMVFILGSLSVLWTYTLMLFYDVGSFRFVFGYYEGGMILPYLLFAYAISIAPWTYMAMHESLSGGGVNSIGIFAVRAASIAMIGASVFYGLSVITDGKLVMIGAIPLVIAWITQMIVVYERSD